MSQVAILVLRVIIAVALAGSLVVQGVLVPLLWVDLEGVPIVPRVVLVVILVLGVLTLQVSAVCVWRLLTLVRRGSVFSPRSFRYVDVVIGAIGTASVLVFGLAVLGAWANRTTRDDVVAPGIVGLVCGFALVVAGVALVVYVLRQLLAQAVDLDGRARSLQSELDEVI